MKRARPSIPSTSGPADMPSLPALAAGGGKRVKFSTDLPGDGAGAPDDDDDLEGTGLGRKKKAVVQDGYDSDSSAGSDDGFGGGGGRRGRKAGPAGEDGEDEEDDMFGPAETEAEGKGKAKEKKEFLEMGDIEGQEFGKGDDDDDATGGDGVDDEDYYEEDDLANDDDAPRSKRSKDSMGYTLSKFNMREELAEGRFAADGTYVANSADPNASSDIWLQGVSKAAIRAAAASKAKMDENAARREEEERRKGMTGALETEKDECWMGILALIRENETVMGALARLGERKKRTDKGKLKTKKAPKPRNPDTGEDIAMDLDPSSTTLAQAPPPTDPITVKIDRLTHYASTLLSTHGELEVYDKTHAEIVQALKDEGAVRRDWVPPVELDDDVEFAAAEAAEAAATSDKGKKKSLIARPAAAASAGDYFYKWKTAPAGMDPDATFGPYQKAQLEGWLAGGYFGDKGTNIVARVGTGGSWHALSELT